MTKKKSIPKCVICKINLEQIDEEDDYLFKCPNPKCKKEYTLFYEVMAYDDDVGTAYDEESETLELEGLAGASGSRLEVKEDELEFPSIDEEMEEEYETREGGKIPIPKYMRDSQTTKVIEYREE
jgi:hypothetical protein